MLTKDIIWAIKGSCYLAIDENLFCERKNEPNKYIAGYFGQTKLYKIASSNILFFFQVQTRCF